MKILIIGELSAFSKNLSKGFHALGHESFVFSWGDGFKKIEQDDDSYHIDVSNISVFGHSIKGTNRIKPGGVRKMLNVVAKKAGVEHVHPHKFRRTLATNLAKKGMAIQEVSAILGHASLDVTMTYVVLDDENIKNAYRRYA